jgi:hypothetical protein
MTSSDVNLRHYIDADDIPADVKDALSGIIDRRAAIDETVRLRRREEERRNAIVREQSRIRENMKNLEKTSDLYGRYVALLDAQETDLAQLARAIDELLSEEQRMREELERYVQTLQAG